MVDKTNQDVIGEKNIRNNEGMLARSDEDNKTAKVTMRSF